MSRNPKMPWFIKACDFLLFTAFFTVLLIAVRGHGYLLGFLLLSGLVVLLISVFQTRAKWPLPTGFVLSLLLVGYTHVNSNSVYDTAVQGLTKLSYIDYSKEAALHKPNAGSLFLESGLAVSGEDFDMIKFNAYLYYGVDFDEFNSDPYKESISLNELYRFFESIRDDGRLYGRLDY